MIVDIFLPNLILVSTPNVKKKIDMALYNLFSMSGSLIIEATVL